MVSRTTVFPKILSESIILNRKAFDEKADDLHLIFGIVRLIRRNREKTDPGLMLIEYIHRDFHRSYCSFIFEPVCGILILGPAYSWPIILSYSISMVSYRSLQNVDHAWPVLMVMNRTYDASRLDGHHTHSKLAPFHAFYFRAKVNRCKLLYRNTFGLRDRLFSSHCFLLSFVYFIHHISFLS